VYFSTKAVHESGAKIIRPLSTTRKLAALTCTETMMEETGENLQILQSLYKA
jgi:hypothetical protein